MDRFVGGKWVDEKVEVTGEFYFKKFFKIISMIEILRFSFLGLERRL